MLYKIRLYIVCIRYSLKLRLKRNLYNLLSKLSILDSKETIDYLNVHHCSISRFGEGEFLVMGGKHNGFQEENTLLAERLLEVLTKPIPNHIVGIPFTLKSRKNLKISSKLFMLEYLVINGEHDLLFNLNPKIHYADSLFTRFYMPYKKKIHDMVYIDNLKNLWQGKDILIVEGRFSRLGVGNDLFSNSASIKRILAPERNAFDRYSELLNFTISHSHNRIVILALGMTATVMSYDLAKMGIQALDIGHVDVEYEWFKMKAKKKCPIPNKMVSEIIDGEPGESFLNIEYEKQVIGRFYE